MKQKKLYSRINMLKDLAIWRRFQAEITQADLKEISEADYGYAAKEHFDALKNILYSGKLPNPLAWEPREVLSLVSWDEYWEEDSKSCKLTHFCSVVLLAASEQKLSNDYLDGQVEKMIIAIDTSNLLGQVRLEELYEFFCYLVPKIKIEDVEEDFLYFYLSLFILASLLNKPSKIVQEHISDVLSAEHKVSDHLRDEYKSDIFSYTVFDQRIGIWRRYYMKYGELLDDRRSDEFL